MERRSLPATAVFAALAVTLACAFVVALWIHERFARYEPRVVAHLPAQVHAAFWMNVEYTVGFDRFAEQFLPLLEEGRTGAEPRVKLLERKTSLELEIDTREFAFARVDSDSWVLLLGGLFRRDGVVGGLQRAFAELGIPAVVKDRVVVLGTTAEPSWLDGSSVTIADDGTLIWASDEALARASMGQHQESRSDYKSLLVKPGSLMAAVAFPEFSNRSGEALLPPPVERLWVSVQPGEPFPAYAEALNSPNGRPDTTLLGEARWQAAQSPARVWAGSTELSPTVLESWLASWASWFWDTQTPSGPAI